MNPDLLRRMTGMKVDDRPPKGGWATGPYLNTCRRCGGDFLGDKRAWICADCAYEPVVEPLTDITGCDV